ncbi:MAG: hypothetical protein AB2729_15790 [Candidatus Thiodiazotropha taylori]|uniref:Uncharacterized protein n=1 Tax=Candidatus Thiodiazotropha taylori TaxID=2792791 RepID=A0A9E4KIC4_9GAMM|nr:hypothetical protein [Candidatus Thiodiazotropha taylori]MCG7954762.1 hypothetical protein [Candidatus Thiodiazotropha taylori]MCG8040462.1 hypothetical protein [Candidatus Thiodiazotropha taylori]MCW4240138.1 hypothetical protein [Candidatus Thiodiazotropha taylori]MCW4257842.1 hypothetical protein [Candidatus Thiodiazotropha taylori]
MLTDNERLPGMDDRSSRPRGFRHRVKQASVRELEVMAVRLRDAGDEKGAEYLERQAVALLDKKICRRVLTQSRQLKAGIDGREIPLIESLA